MRIRRLPPTLRASLVVLQAAFVACTGDAELPPELPEATPEASTVVVRAVDAGTGEAVADSAMTVRWMVRTPMALRAAAVEQVAADAAYEISHAVGTDSLVVELRVEAPSYARLDTVVAVARGESVGPVELPLAFRTDRMVAATPSTRPAPAAGSQGGGPTAASGGSGGGAAAPATGGGAGGASGADASVDRRPLQAGDRAFENRYWRDAVDAYAAMPAPSDVSSEYAREYVLGLVRRGIAHMNLGEWQGALQALRAAVQYDFREYTAYFYLGQVECTLGQFDAGRQTLSWVTERFGPMIPDRQRTVVSTLVDFQMALCSYSEFRNAGGRAQAEAPGRRAIGEFETFIEGAGALSPQPPEVQAALQQARELLAEVRQMLGG